MTGQEQIEFLELDLDFIEDGMHFVQNEVLENQIGNDGHFSIHRFANFPVIQGTIAGTIYHNNVAITTFYSKFNGQTFGIDKIVHQDVHVINICLRYDTGEMLLWWSGVPGQHRCVVSYEYDYEACQEKRRKHTKINWIKDGF
jgi:hypothetical protein